MRFPGGKTLKELILASVLGQPVPGGDQYLGFIFAEAGTRDEVEEAITTAARGQLRVLIE